MKEKFIGKRIGYLCKQKGLTPYQLSARAMVPMTTLDNIIKGNTTNPGIYTICKICAGLEMTLQDLLEGNETERKEHEG